MTIFNPLFQTVPNWWQVIVCLLVITAYGFLFSFIYTKVKRLDGYYKDTPIAFIILPVVTCALIMGVTAIVYNFNGTDTTARYARAATAILSCLLILKIRSDQRTPEVLAYFLFLIGLGLLTGLGYLLYSLIMFIFILLVVVAIHLLKFPRISKRRLVLKITIPEDLNYEHAFDDIFAKYCDVSQLVRVRSSDLGTLFILRYELILKNNIEQKNFLDELRTRNSNLDIVLVNDTFITKDN